MGDAGEPALISTHLTKVGPGLSLLEPLSRKGEGPGLIVLVPDFEGGSADTQLDITDGVPSALMKWAEESYTVIEVRKAALDNNPNNALKAAVEALSACSKCEPKGIVGLVSYDPAMWKQIESSISSVPEIKGAVLYADAATADHQPSPIPCLQHLAGKSTTKLTKSAEYTAYDYPGLASYSFATPFHKEFSYATESVSHTRNLTFLKRLMNGPYFDLEAIWDEHTYFEFEVRDVPKTMATMVEEPYVNHIPTITGGIGRKALSHFYEHHFVFCNPPDTELELISRTVGIDRVVDEFIYKFTHTSEIPWLAPGIPPTNKYCQIPFTAVVNIRGDRLYHEHIAWDSATMLVQMGLMPEYLPFPYPLPNGKGLTTGKRFEYRVPAAGADTAQKMRVKDSVESNELMEYAVREVDA